MTKPLTVARLLDLLRDTLQLELVGDGAGLDRVISVNEVSSPGLVLAGFVERFPSKRMQVFGETEITYLLSLPEDRRRLVLERFFSFDVPCAVVTKRLDVPNEMREIAAGHGVAVLRSSLKTTEFYRRVKPALDEEFAPIRLAGNFRDEIRGFARIHHGAGSCSDPYGAAVAINLQRQPVNQLRLFVAPHRILAELPAQCGLACFVDAQVAFGVEFRRDRIKAFAIPQRLGGMRR